MPGVIVEDFISFRSNQYWGFMSRQFYSLNDILNLENSYLYLMATDGIIGNFTLYCRSDQYVFTHCYD